jgi:predicted Rossmann-fold nucleotide-binding protein
MVEEGFLKEANRKMLLISDDIDNLLNQMESYIAPTIDKWIIKENNLA